MIGNTSKRIRCAGIALGLVMGLLAVAPKPANALNISYVLGGLDPIFTESDFYFRKNFSHVAATGRNYAMWTDPSGNSNNRYTTLELYNPSSNGVCYELQTFDVGSSAGTIADTRIWGQSDATNWVSVNDDKTPGSNYNSKARVWLAPGKGVALRISSYNSAYNMIQFDIRFGIALKYTSAECETPNYPYVIMTGAWPTFKYTN